MNRVWQWLDKPMFHAKYGPPRLSFILICFGVTMIILGNLL